LKLLSHLILINNNLRSLPESISNLKDLEVLYLDNNQFENIPIKILYHEHLTDLSLRKNKISEIPQQFLIINHNFKLMNFADNNIKEFPSFKGEKYSIRFLILNNNKIKNLPLEKLGCNIQNILISNNKLLQLPTDFLNNKKLFLLDVRNNQITFGEEILYNKFVYVIYEGNIMPNNISNNIKNNHHIVYNYNVLNKNTFRSVYIDDINLLYEDSERKKLLLDSLNYGE